jgi:hypothetical protein
MPSAALARVPRTLSFAPGAPSPRCGDKEIDMTDPGPVAPAAPAPAPHRPGADRPGLDPAGCADPGVDRPPGTERCASQGSFVLLLALLWLASMMWIAHAEIGANARFPVLALAAAAQALPALISASMIAGMATGLVAVGYLAPERGAGRRSAVCVPAGALVGLLGGGLIVVAYGATSSIIAIAATVGLSSLVGSLAAIPGRPAVLRAGIGATLSVFLVGVLLGHFQSPIKSLFGEGASVESLLAAATRFFYLASAVGGITAGVVAFIVLRRRGPQPVGWPAYLLGGAAPGLVQLVAWVFTMVGGARLLGAVSGLSAADRGARSYLDQAGLNNALIVGFLGGIVALIAFGRTLGPARSVDAIPAEPAGAEPAQG